MDEDPGGDVEDAIEAKNIEFLNNVADYIENLHAPLECPGLAMEPRDHQYKAVGIIERDMQDKYKALLIGDPPGLGKTLISLMAAVKVAKKA
ncbi:hypothetical protein IQ07DRAFT_638389 [Pyrenochaeta sp. DS3sAY3a]|nr:hypothetical protein IQ07DRAFT_638389 [Pyrenochaeta sp. DS3sAY3a]